MADSDWSRLRIMAAEYGSPFRMAFPPPHTGLSITCGSASALPNTWKPPTFRSRTRWRNRSNSSLSVLR